MAKQLNLFSMLKRKSTVISSTNAAKRNKLMLEVNPVVQDVLENIIEQIVEKEKKTAAAKKTNTDYVMTKEKMQYWPKDNKFHFWDTENGKPSSDGKKISWIKIDTENDVFRCWVCDMYPGISNQKNKVTGGCNVWHRNYLIRHNNDDKHQVIFIFQLFLSLS